LPRWGFRGAGGYSVAAGLKVRRRGRGRRRVVMRRTNRVRLRTHAANWARGVVHPSQPGCSRPRRCSGPKQVGARRTLCGAVADQLRAGPKQYNGRAPGGREASLRGHPPQPPSGLARRGSGRTRAGDPSTLIRGICLGTGLFIVRALADGLRDRPAWDAALRPKPSRRRRDRLRDADSFLIFSHPMNHPTPLSPNDRTSSGPRALHRPAGEAKWGRPAAMLARRLAHHAFCGNILADHDADLTAGQARTPPSATEAGARMTFDRARTTDAGRLQYTKRHRCLLLASGRATGFTPSIPE